MAAGSRWPHAAAATETRVCVCCEHAYITMETRASDHPCSVRLHGEVIVSHESRKIGAERSRDRLQHEGESETLRRGFEHSVEVADPAVFLSYVACRDVFHEMLTEAPVIGEYDLAADNWEVFLPHCLATFIVGDVRDIEDDMMGVVPSFVFDIELTHFCIRLIYNEPKALLLACKEAAAAAEAEQEVEVSNARLPCKRRREPSEQCAICLLDLATEDEETIRLPCSHAFHSRCIAPWFHRVPTCPTCRRDILECFSFVRSASPGRVRRSRSRR